MACRNASTLAAALQPGERFSLFVGELNPSASEALASADVLASTECLAPSGLALWLGLTRPLRTLLESMAKQRILRASVLASRGTYSVYRVSAGKGAETRSRP